jgi:hypothetical protein
MSKAFVITSAGLSLKNKIVIDSVSPDGSKMKLFNRILCIPKKPTRNKKNESIPHSFL